MWMISCNPSAFQASCFLLFPLVYAVQRLGLREQFSVFIVVVSVSVKCGQHGQEHNTLNWDSDWADAWSSSVYLLERSGTNKKKRSIAYDMLLTTRNSKAKWDQL